MKSQGSLCRQCRKGSSYLRSFDGVICLSRINQSSPSRVPREWEDARAEKGGVPQKKDWVSPAFVPGD